MRDGMDLVVSAHRFTGPIFIKFEDYLMDVVQRQHVSGCNPQLQVVYKDLNKPYPTEL